MPCAQAGEKFRRPLVSGFKNDLLPHLPDDHLVLVLLETTRLWQSHSLTASVLKDPRSLGHRSKYIYAYILVKTSPRFRVSRQPNDLPLSGGRPSAADRPLQRVRRRMRGVAPEPFWPANMVRSRILDISCGIPCRRHRLGSIAPSRGGIHTCTFARNRSRPPCSSLGPGSENGPVQLGN